LKKEEPEGIFSGAIEKGKEFGRRFNALKDSLYNPNANSSCFCKPGHPRYPRYNSCISVSAVHQLPPILTSTLDSLQSTSMVVGPGDGFLECINDIPNRKNFLKAQIKVLQQNPNASLDDNSLSVSDITVEELKKKQQQMRTIERKLKKIVHLYLITEPRDSRIYGKTIDTYAYDVIKGKRAGQPNADSFYAEAYYNSLIFGVADGIGWGVPSRRASQSALLGFMMAINEYYSKRKGSQIDTISMAQACYSGIELGHSCVFSNTESKTTFCGGILVKLDDFEEENFTDSSEDSSVSDSSECSDDNVPRWIFVGISVGDSLIYRYSTSTMEVKELTVSDRTGGVRDAGGHLGGKEPDLKNMAYHCCLANEGDLFIAVSDGVHDNLDPEVLKCPLSESGFEIPDGVEDWEDLNTIEKNEKKRRFKEEKLLEIIESVNEVSPRAVTDAIISEIEEITRAQRKGYEEGSRLQRDWDKMEETERNDLNKWVQETLKSPKGKFDHVTCLCVEVSKS